MAVERVILLAFIATTHLHVAYAIPRHATYHSGFLYPTPCYDEDQGTMVAAVNEPLWDNGASGGRFYRLRCTGWIRGDMHCRNGEITVKAIDHCPGCNVDRIEISREAFSVIADPDVGRVDIEYFMLLILKFQPY